MSTGTFVEIKGDLLEAFEKGHIGCIMHGCNCFGIMGAGIAGAISARWPGALKADREFKGTPKEKLGGWSTYLHSNGGLIINAYTQMALGADFRYENLVKLLKGLNGAGCFFSPQVIGIPRIGCGIGGGDWEVVRQVIKENLGGLNIIVYSL